MGVYSKCVHSNMVACLCNQHVHDYKEFCVVNMGLTKECDNIIFNFFRIKLVRFFRFFTK